MFKLCRRSPNFKYNMVFTFLQFSLEQVHSVLFFWWSKQEISLLLALYILSFRYDVLCIKEHQFQVNSSCKISWYFSSISARPLESFQSNCPNATHSVQWCSGLLCVGCSSLISGFQKQVHLKWVMQKSHGAYKIFSSILALEQYWCLSIVFPPLHCASLFILSLPWDYLLTCQLSLSLSLLLLFLFQSHSSHSLA